MEERGEVQERALLLPSMMRVFFSDVSVRNVVLLSCESGVRKEVEQESVADVLTPSDSV